MQTSSQKTSKSKACRLMYATCSSRRVIKLKIRPNKSGTNIRLIATIFMLICGRVHWTLALTSSYSKTFVFDRPHEFLKSNPSGERFQEPPYLWPKTPFTCGREVQTEKKNLRFRKYPGTC